MFVISLAINSQAKTAEEIKKDTVHDLLFTAPNQLRDLVKNTEGLEENTNKLIESHAAAMEEALEKTEAGVLAQMKKDEDDIQKIRDKGAETRNAVDKNIQKLADDFKNSLYRNINNGVEQQIDEHKKY